MSNCNTTESDNGRPDIGSLDLAGGPEPSGPSKRQRQRQRQRQRRRWRRQNEAATTTTPGTVETAPTAPTAAAETLDAQFTTFDKLPAEVHKTIAEYLQPCDLYEVCQVSTRLRELYEAKKWHYAQLVKSSVRERPSAWEEAYQVPQAAAINPSRYARWMRPSLVRILRTVQFSFPQNYDGTLSMLHLFPNLEQLTLRCYLMYEPLVPEELLSDLVELRLPETVRKSRLVFEQPKEVPDDSWLTHYREASLESEEHRIEIDQVTSVAVIQNMDEPADWIFNYFKFPKLQELALSNMSCFVLADIPRETLTYLAFDMTDIDEPHVSFFFLKELSMFQSLRKLEVAAGGKSEFDHCLYAVLAVFQDMHQQGTELLCMTLLERRNEVKRRFRAAIAKGPNKRAVKKTRKYLASEAPIIIGLVLIALDEPFCLLTDCCSVMAAAKQDLRGRRSKSGSTWHKHIRVLFAAIEKIALLEVFWEQVQYDWSTLP